MTNPRWAFERAVLASDLPAPARLILLVLAVVADWPAGTTPAEHTPSLTRLATLTGLSRASIAEHLNRMESGGWVLRLRPTPAQARGKKERTRYRLRTAEAGPVVGLVQEMDQSGSPGDGLVQEMDQKQSRSWTSTSPGAGHKPDRFQTNQTAAPARAAEAIVIDATDATPEEARAVIALIEQTDKPRSLGGFLRRLAADGDLVTRLEKIRAAQQRQDVSAILAAARQGTPCDHGEAGGASLHPVSGEPLCALCRAALRRSNA